MVEGLDVRLVLAMVVVVQHKPLKGLVITPLDELAELVAHKVELTAGVGHLV